MAVYKLQLHDFYEDDPFTLFGIHCNVEEYVLAYQLNNAFQINLKRKLNDIDSDNSKVSYPIYEWVNNCEFTTWHLVANFCKIEGYQNTINTSELDLLPRTTTQLYYLLPELKQVNYLLKVNASLPYTKQKEIVQNMQSIPQIVTAYTINSMHIKSHHNLIFN